MWMAMSSPAPQVETLVGAAVGAAVAAAMAVVAAAVAVAVAVAPWGVEAARLTSARPAGRR